MNNRSQAVRLPKDFQFNTGEVFIRKEGSDDAPVASADFMEGIEDLPAQERKP